MNTATIVPKYVNAAKPQKKYGSVVDGNDIRYVIPADYVNWCQKGEACDLNWNVQTWGDSQVNVVTAINGRNCTGASQPRQGDRPAPDPGHAPVRQATDKEKAKEIFCIGVTQQIARSGNIQQPHEIAQWLAGAKTAWETVMEGKQTPAPQAGSNYEPPDPDDEIPF